MQPLVFISVFWSREIPRNCCGECWRKSGGRIKPPSPSSGWENGFGAGVTLLLLHRWSSEHSWPFLFGQGNSKVESKHHVEGGFPCSELVTLNETCVVKWVSNVGGHGAAGELCGPFLLCGRFLFPSCSWVCSGRSGWKGGWRLVYSCIDSPETALEAEYSDLFRPL